MRRLPAVVALLGVVALLALRPASAFGHAALLLSDPAPNAYLQKPPAQISLTFSEPLDDRASKIRLLDSTGAGVAVGKLTFSRNSLSMTVELPRLSPGVYNVLWANLSSTDGHALQGSYPFTVLNPDGSVPQGVNQVSGLGPGNDPPPVAEGVAVRALSLLGLAVVAAGTLLVLLWGNAGAAARPGLERTIYFGAVILGIATVMNLASIRDAYAGVPLSDVVFHTSSGGYWLTRVGAVMLAAVGATFVRDAPRRASWGLLAVLGVYLWAYTATSHAAAGTGSAWARGIDFAHALSAILWIGAVLGAAVSARLLWRNAKYHQLMPRFSTLASLLVFILLATGIFSSFIEVDTPSKLLDTRYGITLLVKLALIVPLLAMGFYNARWGGKRLARLDPGEPRRFIAVATIEVALGLAVFLTAAFLTQTTVSKAIVIQREAKAFDQTTPAQDLDVSLHVDPNRTGLNTFRVGLTASNGAKVDAQRVRVTFRYSDDQTVGPSTLTLQQSGPGSYAGQGPYLPLEGNWRVEVEIRRENVDDVVTFFAVRPAGQQVNTLNRGGAWDDPSPNLGWNEFGGLALLVIGFGFALFRGPIGSAGRRGRLVANSGSTLGFGLGVLLLFGVHSHAPTVVVPANPIFPDANSVATGRFLYANNCAACHGKNGVPPSGLDLSPYPLDLTVHVPLHSDGVLYNFIAHGVKGSAMQGWLDSGQLTQEQIWHLVNFLRTLTPQNK